MEMFNGFKRHVNINREIERKAETLSAPGTIIALYKKYLDI